ncbi:MAG: sigma factor-like helix-turn-helix DNA-binding protein [Caldisericia bacterium]|nr:sigma factor-like helix-turn-helix DNA-binding protein [Caldisericia bacterium]
MDGYKKTDSKYLTDFWIEIKQSCRGRKAETLRTRLFDEEVGNAVTDESIETAMEEKVRIAQFKQQINQLDSLYRNLLELVMNDVSYGEIAVLYDMPKGTIKSTIHRAKW